MLPLVLMEMWLEDLKKDELSVMPDTAQSGKPSIFFDKDGKEVKHRIFSVPHFGNTFPDQQDVQILAATKHGVKPVQNRQEAENSKGKLVYVGSNPFFYVDKLNNSIPYLVAFVPLCCSRILVAPISIRCRSRAFRCIRLS